MIIFDEFQEILALDKGFPNLMRAVFQTQPEVSHVYLGSKRHLLERIFQDKNEAFWRSAKQLEVGMISPVKFKGFIAERFKQSGKAITDEAVDRLLGRDRRPPVRQRRSSPTSRGSSSPAGGGGHARGRGRR